MDAGSFGTSRHRKLLNPFERKRIASDGTWWMVETFAQVVSAKRRTGMTRSRPFEVNEMRHSLRDIRELAKEVRDPEARDRLIASIDRRIERQPQKGARLNKCVLCGDLALMKANDVCPNCFDDVVRAEIARDREKSLHDGEPLHISKVAHWNGFPHVFIDENVPVDAPFYRGDGTRDESAYSVLEKILTELAVLCLRAFPGVGGEKTEALLESGFYSGSDKVQGIAPKGFKKVFTDLIWLIAFMVLHSKREGTEKGQNLLGSLAAGTLTNADLTEQVSRAGEAHDRAERAIFEKRGKRS